MPMEEKDLRVATFAGVCFWCTEADFDKLPGVVRVISGYTGGQKENPTYAEVSAGTTGHVEAVQVYYDPKQINFEQLLDNRPKSAFRLGEGSLLYFSIP